MFNICGSQQCTLTWFSVVKEVNDVLGVVRGMTSPQCCSKVCFSAEPSEQRSTLKPHFRLERFDSTFVDYIVLTPLRLLSMLPCWCWRLIVTPRPKKNTMAFSAASAHHCLKICPYWDGAQLPQAVYSGGTLFSWWRQLIFATDDWLFVIKARPLCLARSKRTES